MPVIAKLAKQLVDGGAELSFPRRQDVLLQIVEPDRQSARAGAHAGSLGPKQPPEWSARR